MTVIMGCFIKAAEYCVQRFLLPWEYPTFTPVWVRPKINHSQRLCWYTTGFE